MMSPEFVQLSLVPIVLAVLAAVACALPGNFLLLRRQAMIGDAIAHVALPGIVAAFLVTGSLGTFAIMAGASLAAVMAALLIETIRRAARIEAGAAMGVVFTTMFAGGVMLLEVGRASNVHIDAEHLLFGNLESRIWLAASGWSSLLDPVALAELPEGVMRLLVVVLSLLLLMKLFWRPLALSSFDEGFAQANGLPVRSIAFGLVIAAATAAVAAFDAVGPIVAIAMFICPPAAARLMTNHLPRQVAWSLVFAIASAVSGFWASGALPIALGFGHAVSAAGMMATMSGVILAVCCFFGPARSRLSGQVRASRA